MSDFLARLVDRARGEGAAAVRPRLPSLFEPDGGDASPLPPEDGGYRGPAAGLPQLPDEVGSPSIGALPPTPAGDESVARSEAFRTPMPRAPQDTALRTRPIPGHSIPGAERTVAAGPAAVVVPASVSHAHAPLATETDARGAPAADAALPRGRLPGRVEPRRAHAGGYAMEVESGSPGAPEAAASPPTVRVTIGRIEVRVIAEAPASAPSIRRPAPPRLDLDDYLRQRARGER